MSELARSFAAIAKEWLDFVAAFLVTIGGMLMIGGGVYRVFVRPEWTSDQALDALWPFFVIGFVILMLGWVVDRQTPAAFDRG